MMSSAAFPKVALRSPPTPSPHALRQLFRRPAHPPGKRQNGERGRRENEEMLLGSEEFQADRDGHKEQKPVHHD
jgi:hypothetical protein